VFGAPTLALAGSDFGYFGPILNPIPSGQNALDMWDSIHFLLRQPNLFELKRNRKQYTNLQFAD
jgi:hypothetical protein